MGSRDSGLGHLGYLGLRAIGCIGFRVYGV